MSNKVPQSSTDNRDRVAVERFNQGYLPSRTSNSDEGACIKRPCPHNGIDTATVSDKQFGTKAQREVSI
jgi:hypothetical protein